MLPIKRFLDKFPGGIVIIPLLVGCFMNTFFPAALQIGSFTTGIANGTAALIGALFLCLGGQLDLRCAKQAVKTGVVLVIVKYGVSIIIGVIIARVFNNSFLGMSALAVIAGVSNSNGAMFATLTGQYGSESDQGAVAIISINDGPFLTMIALGAAGAANIPFMSVVAALVPLIVGCILGNLDHEMRTMFTNAMSAIIFVSAFAVGCSMSFGQVIQGGISGIILGALAVLCGFINIGADKLTGGTGIAGAAISSVAANAIATPAVIAEIDPAYKSIAGIAAAQLASAVIVTCLVTPFLAAWVDKRNRAKGINSRHPGQPLEPEIPPAAEG